MTTIHYALPFVLLERHQGKVEIWEVSEYGFPWKIWESEGLSLIAASVNYNTREIAALTSPPTTFIYRNAEQEERRWQIDIPVPLDRVSVFALSSSDPVVTYTLLHPVPCLYMYYPTWNREHPAGKDIIANPPLTVVRNWKAVSRFIRAEGNNEVVWRTVSIGTISPPVSGHVCNPAAFNSQYSILDSSGVLRIATIRWSEELAAIEVANHFLGNATPVWGTIENDSVVLYVKDVSSSSPRHIVLVFWRRKLVWVKVVESPPVGAFIDRRGCCFACGNIIYRYDAEARRARAYIIGDEFHELPVSLYEYMGDFQLAMSITWRNVMYYTVGPDKTDVPGLQTE